MRSNILLSKKAELIHPQKKKGTVKWRCPSNIALIKYWGKYEELLPFNPSISLTLNHAHSETIIDYQINEKLSVDYYTAGVRRTDMIYSIKDLIERLNGFIPYLSKLRLVINNTNSFPENSGIMPTSSEIGSLALCLCSIEEEITGKTYRREDFFRRASIIARLGTGCAARSIYGGTVLWGVLSEIKGSSDLHAISLGPDSFLDDLNIAVLNVSTSNNAHPPLVRNLKMQFYNLASLRCEHAKMQSSKLLELIKRKDYIAFCDLVEDEALTLHTLLLSSSIQSILFYPKTLNIISEVRLFRKRYGIPVCFTIDAAPNIYLLYPNQNRKEVLSFINEKLLLNCEDNMWLDDKVGSGPQKLYKYHK